MLATCVWYLCYRIESPDLLLSGFYTAFLFCYFRTTEVVWTQAMVTWNVWYTYKGFLIWIIPSTYQSHESNVCACTTSFVHICTYIILDGSLHVYVCLCSWHGFDTCFLYSDLLIHVYLLDFGFTTDSLIFIYVTRHCLCLYVLTTYLIMYTCDCLSKPTGFILRTRWVIFWQPWTFMSRSRSLDCGSLTVVVRQVAKAWISGCLSDPLFFQPPWSAREILILLLVSIFQSFYIVYHAYAPLGDLIFLKYYIMLCNKCVLILLLLECILPLCFRTLILTCTNA